MCVFIFASGVLSEITTLHCFFRRIIFLTQTKVYEIESLNLIVSTILICQDLNQFVLWLLFSMGAQKCKILTQQKDHDIKVWSLLFLLHIRHPQKFSQVGLWLSQLFLGDQSTFRPRLLGEDLRIVRNTLGLLSFRASPMEKQSSLGRFGWDWHVF